MADKPMTKDEKQTILQYLNNGGDYDDLPLKTREALQNHPDVFKTDKPSIDPKEVEEVLEEVERITKTEEVKIMTKDLKDRAIKVQGGKEYVLVSDRILYFNETYPNGRIDTQLLSAPESDKIAFKAVIYPDTDKPERFFTGHSQAVVGQGMVNKTAAMENAETSAVGRALSFLGVGVIDSIASVDELAKAGAFAKQPHEETEQEYIREVVAEANGQATPQAQLSGRTCSEHNITMIQATSKKTNKPYWFHRSPDNQMCFGRGYES